MVKIAPITAIHPSVQTLEILLAKLSDDKSQACVSHREISLAPNPVHIDSNPAFYLYEFNKGTLLKSAIWALTDLALTPESVIKGHEQTLCNKVESIKNDRKNRSWEKSPVVMVHQPIAALEVLIDQIKQNIQPLDQPWNSLGHTIWKITDLQLIKEISDSIGKLEEIYVADGHHRLEAAYLGKTEEVQGISTLFVPWDAITISPFHRLIHLGETLNSSSFLREIEKYYFISIIPNNVPYRPDRKNRLGMYFQSVWYQLDLKPNTAELLSQPDSVVLQHKILAPILGIDDPQTDQRLNNIPDKNWSQMIEEIELNADLIAFTLYQMDIVDFISHAKRASFLPPKSTYIEPKVPSGMMMNAVLPIRNNPQAHHSH
jgi:uncharacterized protein (DUF1015 family)